MKVFKPFSQLIFPPFMSFQLRHAFSSVSKQTISASAQKAIWASNVIKEIISAKPPSSLSQPSLRQRMIDLTINNDQFQLDDKVRSDVLSAFTKGVNIQYSYIRLKQRTESEYHPRDYLNQKSYRDMLVFWPNYLVTGQMFKALLQNKQNAMIVGSTGISKTVSIFFFCHFASFINKFVFEASQDKNIQEELKNLRELNLLCDPPKYWYGYDLWNFQRQAPQIPKKIYSKYLQKMHNSRQTFNKIRGLYSAAGITQRVIFDHFNDHTRYMIAFNHTPKLKLQNQKDERKMRQDLKYYKQLSMKSLKYLEEISQFGESILFIERTSLPRQIMEQRKEKSDQFLTFNLVGEGKSFQQIEIKFKQNLKEEWARVDFSHLIWFDIERQCRYHEVSSEKLNELKELFYKNIVGLKLNTWDKISTTHAFKFYNNRFYKQLEFDYESTRSLLGKLSDFYKERTFSIIKENLESFIHQPGLTFMDLLYVYAQKNISNPNLIKISDKNLNEAIKKQNGQSAFKYYFNYRSLSVKYDSANETIEFEWNAQQLVSFVKAKPPCQQFSLNFPLAVYIIRVGARVRFGPLITSTDQLAEFQITKAIFFDMKSDQKLLPKVKVECLCFDRLFKMAEKYPLKYIGMLPRYSDKNVYDFVNLRPLSTTVLQQHQRQLKPDHIDFVIAKYDDDEELYEIYSFLIVVDSAKLQEQLKRSKQFLAEFTMESKFKFTHVMVLTDYDNAKEYPSIEVNNNCSIIYRNFNEINVQAINKRYDKKYYNVFKHFRTVAKINEMANQI